MDFIIEFFLELYMELMLLIVPEQKRASKKLRLYALLFAFSMLAIVFALVIWGAVLIVDKDNLLGIIPISIAVILSIVQIIMGWKLYSKTHKK